MAVLAGHRDRYSLSVICVFLALTSSAAAVYVQGNINTTEDWVYIAQFCYLSSGNLDYELLYPKAFGVEKLLLYFDDKFTNATSGSQNCTERVSFLGYEFNTIIDLSERSFAGCNVTRIDGDEYYKCEERIVISASRSWMWYVALARCELSEGGNTGLRLNYTLHFTNGQSEESSPLCKASANDFPTTNCPLFVTEGETLSCKCRPPQTDLTWTKLSWKNHSSGSDLEVKNVKREHNGTQFTCQMHLENGGTVDTVYTLQVAYGPSGSNVKVTGPSSFLTNGDKRMTLTCETGEVNPVPKFTWEGAICENGNEDNTCTFSPHPHDDSTTVTCVVSSLYTKPFTFIQADFALNLKYPPLKPPQLSGYNTTSKIVKPDDSPKCTVEGGKPLVTSVVYSCSNDTLPDEQDVRTEIFVSSSLTLDSSSVQETEVVCKCVAVWDPQPDLYSLSQEGTIYLQMSSEQNPNEHDRQLNSETLSQSAVGAIVAPVLVSILAVTIIIMITFVIFVLRRRRKRSYERDQGRSPFKSTHTFSNSTVMFLLPPSIEENDAASDKDDDDAHVLNIKMDPGYVSAEDLDIPDVVSSGSESLGPEIQVTPCFTGETSDYAVVGEMTPSQKCVSIKRDPGSGYSEVQIHDPTARADTTGPSAKPCDAAEPPLTNTCDQPVTPVPNCHADNHQFSLERVRGPLGDQYTLVNKLQLG